MQGMFIKTKTRGQKTYYELAHSQRKGAKVKQYSVYLGPSLSLTGQKWIDTLRAAKFPASIRKLFPIVDAFVRSHNLPPPTIQGLRDAAELEWQRGRPTTAHHRLGLAPGASIAQIKTAFRKLSLTHHPDHGGNPEEFKKLVKARDTLLAISTPTLLTDGPTTGSEN
jgi:hypothetical protein